MSTLQGTKNTQKLQDMSQFLNIRDQDQIGLLERGNYFLCDCSKALFLCTASGTGQGQRQLAGPRQPWV